MGCCAQNRPGPSVDGLPPHEQYVLDVLLNLSSASSQPSKPADGVLPTPAGISPCPSGQKGSPQVVPVLLSTIHAISHLRIVLPKDLRQDQARETAWKSVLEVQRRFPNGIALLDPVENMGIKDEKFKELVKVLSSFFFLPGGAMPDSVCRRKSISWKRSSFRRLCIKILDCLNSMNFTPRRRKHRNASRLSKSVFRQHRTFCRWRNSSVGNVSSDGWVSRAQMISWTSRAGWLVRLAQVMSCS